MGSFRVCLPRTGEGEGRGLDERSDNRQVLVHLKKKKNWMYILCESLCASGEEDLVLPAAPFNTCLGAAFCPWLDTCD